MRCKQAFVGAEEYSALTLVRSTQTEFDWTEILVLNTRVSTEVFTAHVLNGTELNSSSVRRLSEFI